MTQKKNINPSLVERLIELEQENTRLKKENSELKNAIEGVGIGWWIYQPDSGILYISSALASIFGKKQFCFTLTNPNPQFIHPDDYEKAVQAFNEVIEGKTNTVELEFRLKNHKKEYQWFFNKGKIAKNHPSNQAPQLAGIIYELDNKKQTEKSLNSLNIKYKTIFNYSNDSIFLNYITQKKPGNFIEVNDTAVKEFGYSHEDFRQLNPLKVLLFNNSKRFKELWEKLLSEKNILFENQAMTKNGEIKTIEINSVIIALDHQFILLSVSRDITERKKTQNELLKARDIARQSNELKNAFLANISHEIRTPMNAIAGFSGLLANDNLDKKTKQEYVSIINTNTNLLLRLITDIIDLSKIETGILKIIESKVELNQVVKYLYDIFKSELYRLNKKNIKLQYKQALPLHQDIIITDPLRLNQVLYNLLLNAIKYTDKGYVEYGYFLRNKDVVFYVKDSGIGIVKEKQDVIFDHFRQANDEFTKKNHGGTGLGLSISKKLVELLGGKIWVESETNKGSTFYFVLPNVYHNRKNSKPDIVKPNWCGKTILIISESEDIINFFNLILFETGVNLIFARTGEEAMHLVKTNANINLAIINNSLPDIEGTGCAKIIKDIHPELKIAIIEGNRPVTKENNDVIQAFIKDAFNEIEVFANLQAIFKK